MYKQGMPSKRIRFVSVSLKFAPNMPTHVCSSSFGQLGRRPPERTVQAQNLGSVQELAERERV